MIVRERGRERGRKGGMDTRFRSVTKKSGGGTTLGRYLRYLRYLPSVVLLVVVLLEKGRHMSYHG